MTSSRQLCHIIHWNPVLPAVAVWPTPLGWMLPVVTQPEFGPLEYCEWKGAEDAGELLHCARFQSPGNAAGLCGYRVHLRKGTPPEGAIWQSVIDLPASQPLLAEQAYALRLAQQRLLQPEAPFDSVESANHLSVWVRRSLGLDPTSRDPCRIHWLRKTRFDAVGIHHGARDQTFVKAGGGRLEEAQLVDMIGRHFPGTVPRTIALDPARGWWLTEQLHGRALSQAPPTASDLEHLVHMIVALQHRLSTERTVAALLHARIITADSLARTIDQTLQIYLRANPFALSVDEIACVDERLRAACRVLMSHCDCLTWIHSDLRFDNIFAADGEYRLLDFEYGCWGPPALALWPLIKDSVKRDPRHRGVIERAFVAAWRSLGVHQDAERLGESHLVGSLLKISILMERLGFQEGIAANEVVELYKPTFVSIAEGLVSRARQPAA